MSATTYYKNKIRDHANGVATYTPPATVYIGLHTGNPGATGASNEVATGSYARVALTNDGTGWSAAAAGVSDNLAVVQFPDPTANWGTITHFSKWDALTGGNCEEYGALSQGKVVNNGDPGPRFPIGELELTCA